MNRDAIYSMNVNALEDRVRSNKRTLKSSSKSMMHRKSMDSYHFKSEGDLERTFRENGTPLSDMPPKWAKDSRNKARDDSLKETHQKRRDLRRSETKLRRYKNTYKKVVRRKVGLGLGVAGALAGTAALVAKARSAKKDA